MSEKLLEGLMHLFAILAREGSVTVEETEVVKAFLFQQLNQAAAGAYLQKFEAYTVEDERVTLLSVADAVCQELTQKQKIVVLIRLIELINADQVITATEAEAIAEVARVFLVKEDEFNEILCFAADPTPHLMNQPCVLRIGSKLPDVYSASHQIALEGFPGYVAVLRVASVETYILKYYGTSDVYVNGQLIRPGHIYFLAPGSVIKNQKHAPIYYSDIVSRFLADEKAPKTVFEALNVGYRFVTGKVGLHDVTLKEESGKLIGLMGASGAGKSTLLNVLNGNYTPSSGQVLINGINIHRDKKNIEGVIGYVSQDDLLIEELTVEQNLYFSAKLSFDKLTEEELQHKVTKLLTSLGLLEIKDLKVGNPLNKKISGGQRKRLNIALELIREPAVLFVDEPTSGLSSRDSENIMDLLKELSLRGKLVFVVIHQPSSDIFKMFDKLYILDVGGYPIYYGNPVEAISYFKRQASLINSDYAECSECGSVNPEQLFNIIEGKVLDEHGNFTAQRKFRPQDWHEAFLKNVPLPEVSPSTLKPEKALQVPGPLKQMSVFIRRDVLAKLANTSYLVINFLEAPLLAILLATILRYASRDSAHILGYTLFDNENLPAYLFICVLVALFMGLTVSAEEILRDRKILKREAFLNLSRQSYLLSKVLILFVISAIQTLSFVLLGNLILGIQGMTLAYWLVLFSTSCFANMLGLNISASFDNAVTIYILVPILLIPQIILSGVLVKFDKLNPVITTVGEVPAVGNIMASRWAYEALAVKQFTENEYERNFAAQEQVMSQASYKQSFWLPRLEAKLDFCTDNYRNPLQRAQVSAAMTLLQHELKQEVQRFGRQQFPELDRLTPDAFNEQVAAQIKALLTSLREDYAARYNTANAAKDKRNAELMKQLGAQGVFALKMKAHNQALADMLTNKQDAEKVLELDGHLVQNMDPVFTQVQMNHSAPFYSAEKPFFGNLVDTYVFDVSMIWLMCLILYITLYFESLRSLIRVFGGRRRE